MISGGSGLESSEYILTSWRLTFIETVFKFKADKIRSHVLGIEARWCMRCDVFVVLFKKSFSFKHEGVCYSLGFC